METQRPRIHEQLNSVKHFQQHSRLHFIGQWKTKAHDLFKEWFTENPSWNHGVLSRQTIFAHLDMDAFFCSVALAKEANTHLRDKPVCVAAGMGNSDISSCNYVARSYGVRAGMYVNAARTICPNLHVLGYDLPRCAEVAKCLYRIIFELCPARLDMSVEVYSIDEVMIAFDSDDYDAVGRYCSDVRHELEVATKCTISCGIGPNVMLARIATQSAKPNGIFAIQPNDVKDVMLRLPFSKIHGAGASTIAKLLPLLKPYLRVTDCEDESDILCYHVQKLTKTQLQQALGHKSGENFYNLCRGNDVRVVRRTGDEENQRLTGKRAPTSIGCSMNYAVRPSSVEDVWSIVRELLEVVCGKMKRGSYCCSGLRVTLLERHPLHPKTTQKYMGRGKCVEFNMPISFESPMRCNDFESMFSHIKGVLSKLLIPERTASDEERARELGLDKNTDSGVIWTVSISTVSDIVIEDVRGMTIQATGVRLEHRISDGKKHSSGVQMSLADAFSKVSAKHQQVSCEKENSKMEDEELKRLSPSSPGCVMGLQALEELMNHEVDEIFVSRWKNLAGEVGRQTDYTAMKSLIRVAALRCASAVGPVGKMREVFTELVSFAQGLMPYPVAFT
uniref:Putative DNA damage repair protein n=1 Tax=Trypanosoma congolense (strain IL3000) TaxID=1068625 RepID=G0UW41_TRYCI|nr:putative DNA damage repair protein [Trypanosoma congolense IL3000]